MDITKQGFQHMVSQIKNVKYFVWLWTRSMPMIFCCRRLGSFEVGPVYDVVARRPNLSSRVPNQLASFPSL